MKNFIATFLIFLLMGCTLSRPLSGPGYDSHQNRLEGDSSRLVVVAMTNAFLDRKKRGAFDQKTQSLYKNLESYEGYLAGSIRLRLGGEEVWTYTIWRDEAALKNFLHSREHLDAMFRLDSAIKKIRSLTKTMPARDVPVHWREVEVMIGQQELKNYQPL